MKKQNTNTSGDPLRELLVGDVKSMDREKLAHFLNEKVVLDSAEGVMHFLPAFDAMDNNRKIEVILAASKARSLLFEKPDGMLPKEIIALDVMPTGSVKTSLKTLSKDRKIKKDSGGRYFLPGYRIGDLTISKTIE